jgi:cysteine-rich repeat protein
MRNAIGVAALALILVACGSNAKKGATCGDGQIESGEECDDGAANGTAGDGCNADCTFACANPSTDCPAPAPCMTASCSADHVCETAPDATQEGMSCGLGMVCRGGACVITQCGNGIVEPGEQCDFGIDNGVGTGCEQTCMYSCQDSTTCDDGNPCNGAETCGPVTVSGQMGQKCSPGTAEANGTPCGTGMICINSACMMGVCGDGFVTAPEECDDANTVNGDGCDNDCKYSCVSTDPTRNCTPADACAGQGTCNDTTHKCTAGTPLTNGTPCGTGNDYCKNSVCTTPVCGNGVIEPGEVCDDGALNGTASDGCTATCTYVCVNPMTDCGTPPVCEKWTCAANHTCAAVADATQNGMTCAAGKVCNNGSCATPSAVCGNGIVESGEQCDFGAGNGPGTGCESNCTFSCTMVPNSCDDGNPCNGAETCNTVTVSGHTGQKCAAGTPESNGTNCGTGKICITQACVTSTCGDGYIDPSIGETCEPPGTSTCDAQCHLIVCGNGIRQGTEQCDDGNTTNLDGCDSSCKFEQVQRMDTLSIAFNVDSGAGAYCTKNALGVAIVGTTAQTDIEQAISNGLHDGSITVIFNSYNLDDLTGTSDPSLQLGVLGGSPTAGATYVGDCPPQNSIGLETGPCTTDLDWWYTTDPTTINASRIATSQIAANIAAKVLNVPGPVEVSFTVSFVGVAVTMDIYNAKTRFVIGPSSAPLASTGAPPGHLASEHLDPALQSYQTTSGGEMCGTLSAQSLYNTLAPSALTGAACGNFFTTSNTLLDVYISGCKALGFIGEVNATQPDASRDGATYVFSHDATHHVNGCTRNGAADTLQDCLTNAGFTSLFRYTTDRIISK